MSYTEQIWQNGPNGSTPISAERLTHMEGGIKDNSNRLDALQVGASGRPLALSLIFGG